MAGLIEPLQRLANQFARLPSIGPKSAQRLAFHVLSMSAEQVNALADAIVAAKQQVHFCSICGMFTDQQTCDICRDPRRDSGVICVVKDPKDVLAMERAREFHGQYHVLHGVIAPMSGVGPDDIRIRELLQRLEGGTVREVILATNPDVEGDVTAMYLAQLIKPLGIKVSRIAHGVPIGGELEYTDDITLSKALEGRREL
nr:recombination mediator RecR [bacterium]